MKITLRSDGGNTFDPGGSPADHRSRVGSLEDKEVGPGVIAKVKPEFVVDSFPQRECLNHKHIVNERDGLE